MYFDGIDNMYFFTRQEIKAIIATDIKKMPKDYLWRVVDFKIVKNGSVYHDTSQLCE